MTVTLGSTVFDKVRYDEEADVLYLSVEGREAVHWEESREGHVLRFDSNCELMGVTIVDMREHLDNDHIAVTVPNRAKLTLPRELEFA
jgi:uncharacterized protein YuzE